MNAHVRIEPRTETRSFSGLTASEFFEILETGALADVRVELVGGVIEKMAPAAGGHSRQNFSVAQKIALALGDKGVSIGTDLAVAIDDITIRGVDIAVSLKGFAVKGPTQAQDIFLAVEIADTTLGRDLGEKALEYAACGIPNYWVVDLNACAVHVMSEPGAMGYAGRSVIRYGELLPVPGTERTITID